MSPGEGTNRPSLPRRGRARRSACPLSGADPAWSADRGSCLRRPGQSRGSSRKTWAFSTSGPVG